VNGIQAALSGKVVSDPEQRYTQKGTAMLQLSVAVDEDRRRPDVPTTWVRATLWEEMAEQMAQRLEKGDDVYLEGRLTLGRWQGQDGGDRCGLNLSVTRCDVMGAIGRSSTRAAPAQHQAGTVLRPTSLHRPADDGPAEPLDFDEPRRLNDHRQRIAAAAAEGAQRAQARRGWGR
jgi:single-strand DNA-binding protein